MNNESNTDFLQNSPITIQQNYFSEPSVGRTTSRNLKFPFNMIWSCFAFNVLPILKIWLCYEFTVSGVRQRNTKVVRGRYLILSNICFAKNISFKILSPMSSKSFFNAYLFFKYLPEELRLSYSAWGTPFQRNTDGACGIFRATDHVWAKALDLHSP